MPGLLLRGIYGVTGRRIRQVARQLMYWETCQGLFIVTAVT